MDISIKDFTEPFTTPICGTVNPGSSLLERAGFEQVHGGTACRGTLVLRSGVFPRFKGSHAMRK